MIEDIPETGFIQVGRIDCHMAGLHFTDHLQTIRLQPLRFTGFGRIADCILVVPYKCSHADAEISVLRDSFDPFFEDFAAFHAEHEGVFAFLHGGRVIDLMNACILKHFARIQFAADNAVHIPAVSLTSGPQGKGLQGHTAFSELFGGNHQSIQRSISHTDGIERIRMCISDEHRDTSQFLAAFNGGNLIDSPLMSSAFKSLSQPGAADHFRNVHTDDTRSKGQNIGVVMPLAERGSIDVRTGADTDAGNLSGRHADADTGSADQDAAVTFAAGNGSGCTASKHRIVAAFTAVGSEILVLQTHFVKQMHDFSLQIHTGMVTGKSNHDHVLLL